MSELKNHSAEMGWLMAGLNIPTHTPTLYFIPYCMTLCGYHQYGMLIAPYLVVQTVHHTGYNRTRWRICESSCKYRIVPGKRPWALAAQAPKFGGGWLYGGA